MTVVYEDNHIIVVNKTASEIVQADKTGDTPLSETVKQYLKEKYHKPGKKEISFTDWEVPTNICLALRSFSS
jgi:23S rRNA pseudouridine1911/1915/1917 synthase